MKSILLASFGMLFSVSALADSTCAISWVNADSNKIRGTKSTYSIFNDELAQIECPKLANVYAEMFTLSNKEQSINRHKTSRVEMVFTAESLDYEITKSIAVEL